MRTRPFALRFEIELTTDLGESARHGLEIHALEQLKNECAQSLAGVSMSSSIQANLNRCWNDR